MSTIVEHVVLFRVKDSAEPSESDAMVDRLNSLVSLDQLLHFTMEPLLRIRSSSSTSLNFTHILHGRYNSKHDLDAYSVHPTHVAAVKANAPLLEDIMALDWVAEDLQGDLVPPPGSALRVTFFKLKEDLGNHVKHEVLEAIREIQNDFGQVIQLSSGQNFSPGRAKGFSIASLAVFPGLSELEAADSDEELEKYQKNGKIKEHLESLVFLDYVVPLPKAQSSTAFDS